MLSCSLILHILLPCYPSAMLSYQFSTTEPSIVKLTLQVTFILLPAVTLHFAWTSYCPFFQELLACSRIYTLYSLIPGHTLFTLLRPSCFTLHDQDIEMKEDIAQTCTTTCCATTTLLCMICDTQFILAISRMQVHI